jgi:hypothetical protein
VHADPAADHQAGVGLADDPERGALARVLAQAMADRGAAAGKGEEPLGTGNQIAVGGGIGDLLRRDIPLLHRGKDTE